MGSLIRTFIKIVAIKETTSIIERRIVLCDKRIKHLFMFLIFCRRDFYILWVENENLGEKISLSNFYHFYHFSMTLSRNAIMQITLLLGG